MNFDCKVSEVKTRYIPQRDLKYASGMREAGYFTVLQKYHISLLEIYPEGAASGDSCAADLRDAGLPGFCRKYFARSYHKLPRCSEA